MRRHPDTVGSERGYTTIRLGDGRRLGFAQWGNPHGTPVLEFRGLPSSRLGDAIDPGFLLAHRIRRITVDRPGVGRSDDLPGRRLLDWPDDVLQLADALGLDRFWMLATSGGGPYALACARRIPGRLERVGLVSGLGPLDRPGAVEGMNPTERRIMLLARRMPVLARAVVGLAVAAERRRPGTLLGGLTKAMPACDRAVLARPQVRASLMDSYARAFAHGTRGQVHDWGVIATPWGFAPEEIGVEVQLWQGDQDDRVPAHHAEYLAAAIPHSRLRILPGQGHMIAFTCIEQALGADGQRGHPPRRLHVILAEEVRRPTASAVKRSSRRSMRAGARCQALQRRPGGMSATGMPGRRALLKPWRPWAFRATLARRRSQPSTADRPMGPVGSGGQVAAGEQPPAHRQHGPQHGQHQQQAHT